MLALLTIILAILNIIIFVFNIFSNDAVGGAIPQLVSVLCLTELFSQTIVESKTECYAILFIGSLFTMCAIIFTLIELRHSNFFDTPNKSIKQRFVIPEFKQLDKSLQNINFAKDAAIYKRYLIWKDLNNTLYNMKIKNVALTADAMDCLTWLSAFFDSDVASHFTRSARVSDRILKSFETINDNLKQILEAETTKTGLDLDRWADL